MTELKPTCCIVDSEFKVLQFLDTDSIEGMKRELRTYPSKAADVANDMCKLPWWNRHFPELPNWSKACKSLLVL